MAAVSVTIFIGSISMDSTAHVGKVMLLFICEMFNPTHVVMPTVVYCALGGVCSVLSQSVVDYHESCVHVLIRLT